MDNEAIDEDLEDYELFLDEDEAEDEDLEFPNGDTDAGPHGLRRPPGKLEDPSFLPRPVRRRRRHKGPKQRGREKQLENELPWRLTPIEKQDMFREAEGKQWDEHFRRMALPSAFLTEE